MSMAYFKEIVRQQVLILQLNEERAIATLPELLAKATTDELTGALDLVRRVAAIGGAPTGEVKTRLDRIEAIFEAVNKASKSGSSWKVAAARSPAPVRKRAPPNGDRGRRTKRQREVSGA